jgi:hypothetical protein
MSLSKALQVCFARAFRLLALAALASAGAMAMTGAAAAYSAKVTSACKSDFKRFCPSYEVGTSELRACMRSAGGNLSTRCIDALADSGEISMKYHSRNRKK